MAGFGNFPPVIAEERSVVVVAQGLCSYKSQAKRVTYIENLVELLFL
jgi:hypothetical protein